MNKFVMMTLVLVGFMGSDAFADQQSAIDGCIEAWGKSSPFKKGTAADKTISPGVKVFGIGKNDVGDTDHTSKPSLVLIRPTVNVLGKSTIKLMNPNGWYCFKANVSVLGKIALEADCKAHFASANEDGTSVLAADDSDKSVAVLGSVRIHRNCEASEAKSGDKEKATDTK